MFKVVIIYLIELDFICLENVVICVGNNLLLVDLVDDFIVCVNVVFGNKIFVDVVIMNLVVCVVDDVGVE